MDNLDFVNEAANPEELAKQVYDEMIELNARIIQSQKELDEFTLAVKKLNEDMEAARKQWDEMTARHKEIYKPRDISALLKRAGIEPDTDTE